LSFLIVDKVLKRLPRRKEENDSGMLLGPEVITCNIESILVFFMINTFQWLYFQ